jgi:hypothetical protein
MDQPTRSTIEITLLNGPSPLWRALVLLLFGCACFAFWGAVQPSSLNRIQRENRQPGTTAWQLTNPADNRQIEGYASLTSVPVGGNIDLFVNTKEASYTLTVFRMGWYGGKGGRKVQGPQTLAGVQQITPDPTAGLPECHWTNPVHIHVPSSWVSGIYLAKLHGKKSGKESYITFTVRDSRRADLVFQQSVITYQAYNPWPGLTPLGGTDGYSLYNVDANGAPVPQVSFSRPYGTYPADDPFYTDPMFYSSQFARYGVGAGDFLRHAGPAAMEYSMVRWLEHEGYDVTYITDVDTHENVGRLLRGKGYLSVGHDEYWSEEMRANIIQARDAGVSLGFFGGNYIYWAVELLPDATGTPNRTISLVDPTKTCTFTCMGRSEQSVVGGNWVGSVPTNGDIAVLDDAPAPPLGHWVFANTGLMVGDIIPGLIGVEYNGTDPNVDIPDGLQILLHTQAPRFESGLVADNGGYPLPANFNGDFNAWYEQAAAVAAANNGRYDLDQKVCEATGNPCSTIQDCGAPADCGEATNPDCNPENYKCIYPCRQDPIPPLNKVPPDGFCSNPWPVLLAFGGRSDWSMTIYQANSGAWVFNAATNQWSWGLDDYFTGLQTPDGANNGPAFRTQCGYPWFHPGLVSCRNPAIEQITRNVLNKFIGRP